ncbi:hypothetical protein JA1_004710 [Spathaspora sp. JA1]|nr:hypothetical protein JA1_004710 [Spathaspora sp. JA1]
MSGRFPSKASSSEESTFEKIKSTPAFIIGTQAVLFAKHFATLKQQIPTEFI